MKIKYVGLKDFEDAFSGETGKTWGPGVEHDIEDLALCKRMLNHPDVFAMADGAPVKEPATPPAAPSGAEGQPGEKAPQTDDNGNVPGADDAPRAKWIMRTDNGKPLVLDTLDRDTLHKLAEEAGLQVRANARAETVAERLAEAFPWTEET